MFEAIQTGRSRLVEYKGEPVTLTEMAQHYLLDEIPPLQAERSLVPPVGVRVWLQDPQGNEVDYGLIKEISS